MATELKLTKARFYMETVIFIFICVIIGPILGRILFGPIGSNDSNDSDSD